MDKVCLAMFILALASIAMANMIGNTMVRVVFNTTGTKHWPAGANRKLLHEYLEIKGMDANTRGYVIFHLVGVVFGIAGILCSVLIRTD
jgi:hypothetical protein